MDFTIMEWMMLITGAIISVVIQKLYDVSSAYLTVIRTSEEHRTMLKSTFRKMVNTYSLRFFVDFSLVIANIWSLVMFVGSTEPLKRWDIVVTVVNVIGAFALTAFAAFDGLRWWEFSHGRKPPLA